MSIESAPFTVPRPDISHLVTEDDTPVDIYSEKQQRLFQDPLYSSWKYLNGGRPFVSMTNVGLFYGVKKPPVVPDGLLSLDVELPDDPAPKENRSYFLWEYAKPPELVLEVVSNTEGGELGPKKEIYARIAVLYYVVWDPFQFLGETRLHVFVLHGKRYRPLEKPWFPEIDLGFTIWHGLFEDWTTEWLRWCDRQGKVLLTGREARQVAEEAAEGEKRRADAEKQRAETEKQRAETEKQRADKLAAQLRALGVEPLE